MRVTVLCFITSPVTISALVERSGADPVPGLIPSPTRDRALEPAGPVFPNTVNCEHIYAKQVSYMYVIYYTRAVHISYVHVAGVPCSGVLNVISITISSTIF